MKIEKVAIDGLEAFRLVHIIEDINHLFEKRKATVTEKLIVLTQMRKAIESCEGVRIIVNDREKDGA